MKTPPVDPDFYAIGANSGMTDEEIQQDWEAYCRDLEKFHDEIDSLIDVRFPAPPSEEIVTDLVNEMKKWAKDGTQ